MINEKRAAVMMPAFNAEKTLEQTVRDLPDGVDIKILVDDSSTDRTAAVANRLGVQTFVHDRNYGYGRNRIFEQEGKKGRPSLLRRAARGIGF